MSIHEILQITFYSLAGLLFLALLVYLLLTKRKKVKEKISLILMLLLSFAQSFVYIIMSAINSNASQDNWFF